MLAARRKKSDKSTRIDLYHEWLAYNRNGYSRYFNFTAIVLSMLLIPFDFILFERAASFSRVRVLGIICFLLMFAYSSSQSTLAQRIQKRFSWTIFGPGLLFNAMYLFFLVTADEGEYTAVLFANYMVAFTTTFFFHRFWSEQYALTFCAVVSLTVAGQVSGLGHVDFTLLTIFHLVSAITAGFFRREFVISMEASYRYLTSMVPQRVAKYMAISPDGSLVESTFQPTERYTVCLCADWRGYQHLASKLSSAEMSRLFERYYDLVLDELEKCAPDGNYFANWTADELFVIFYSESDLERAETGRKALRFARSLATVIHTEINAKFETKLCYDIGIASGVGLLGLQGPKKLKKTTLTAECAGVAKRLEQEAKHVRALGDSNGGSAPVLMMDEPLYWLAIRHAIFEANELVAVSGTIKDIKGKVFYSFREEEVQQNKSNNIRAVS